VGKGSEKALETGNQGGKPVFIFKRWQTGAKSF
jgi:hypothetical protein